MPYEVRIVEDSTSSERNRLTTWFLRYPKFIHGEFMTHRRLSRSASSSRAVPIAKMVEEARNPALRASPIFWGKNQKGMQAVEELSAANKMFAIEQWGAAARIAAYQAEILDSIGAHKQIVNRVLEPYLHINVVCSGTEFMNFFGLRLDKAAQPEIRQLAELMWAAYDSGNPSRLMPGEWHLPFLEEEDYEALGEVDGFCLGDRIDSDAIKVSVARCARTSYLSYETGKRSTVAEDLRLYNDLMVKRPIHASPAEHQGTPDEPLPPYVFNDRIQDYEFRHMHQWGNFQGWRQYRKMLPGEDMAPLPEGYVRGSTSSSR